MNFDYSLQTKEKKQKQKNSPAINNFYFLVLDYFESWLNLMIVSMFRSESRKVGAFKIVNPKHIDCTPMQNSTLSVLNSLSTGLKYLIVTQKLFSFFLIGIHSMQDWAATTRHGVTKKRSTKRLNHTGNLFRKNLQLSGVWLFYT